jgi:hypothetical protein
LKAQENMIHQPLVPRGTFILLLVAFVFAGGRAGAEKLGDSWSRRYDQNTFLGAHNAYATTGSGYRRLNANQLGSIKNQLDAGVRCLSLDIFLMREKEEDALMKFEMYEERDAFRTPSPGFTNILPGIVLAHEPDTWGYSLFDDYLIYNHGFENIFTVLTDIEEWMGDNLSEVVTIVFESYVAEPSILWQYFRDAGLANMVFYADRPNPDFPGPDGHPWSVLVHGWPRLGDMVSAGRRLVVFSSNGVQWNRYSGQPIGGASTTDDDGLPYYFNSAVENEYGTDGIEGGYNVSRNDNALDNMLFPLAWMNWFPDANVVGPDYGGGNDPDQYTWDYGNLNSYGLLNTARNSFAAAAKRYPNFISVDFYHKGGDGGPRRLVRECNTYWASRPVVTASMNITPAPNLFGWRKSAQVLARGDTDNQSLSVRWLNYYWHGGHDILGHAEQTNSVQAYPVVIPLHNGMGTNHPTLGRTNDGIFRVSVEAVSALGDRSDRAVAWVRIDSTPPLVQPVAARPPDGADGWFNHPVLINVTVADLLSGARRCWWTMPDGQTNFSEVYVSSVTNQFIERTFQFEYEQEGHVFLRFTGEDHAGNSNPTNSGFILMKMDRTPPSTSVTLSNAASTNTVRLLAADATSGMNGTWYQVDASTNWIVYAGPIALSSTQAHTLRFFSRDLAGNEESVKTFHIGQTAISLSAERTPAGYYQALDITATITGPGPRPTGTVTFRDGTNIMGTVTLDTNGVARLTLTPLNYTLARGSHELTAEYNGNANYAATTSPVLAQEVVDPPAVMFTVSPGTALQTQPVSFNATVTSGDERIPTGTILFRALNGVSGREILRGVVSLDTNGHASFITAELPFAYLILLADYSGDAQFPPASFGGVRELFILEARTEITVTTAPNPSRYGEPVKFTVAAISTEGATPPVNGSIRIDEWDEELETLPLSGTNVVTYVTSSLSPGGHSFLFTANTMPRLSGGVGMHQHVVLPQEVPPPGFRSLRRAENGAVQLELDVMPGHGVQLEYSLTLTNWLDLTKGTNLGTVLEVSDTAATNHPARFYRARLLD